MLERGVKMAQHTQGSQNTFLMPNPAGETHQPIPDPSPHSSKLLISGPRNSWPQFPQEHPHQHIRNPSLVHSPLHSPTTTPAAAPANTPSKESTGRDEIEEEQCLLKHITQPLLFVHILGLSRESLKASNVFFPV